MIEEQIRTAVHNAMIDSVLMSDDSKQAWDNAVETITKAVMATLQKEVS